MSHFIKVGTRRINLDQIRDVFTTRPDSNKEIVIINFVAIDSDGESELLFDGTEAEEFLRILDREIEILSYGGSS